MRVAFLYGAWSVGSRPFDLDALWDDRRGLTGSEVSYFSYARELSRRGHEVSLFLRAKTTAPRVWEGMAVADIGTFNAESSAGLDAAVAWNEPDLLRGCAPGVRRVMNQQLNDFNYCQPGFDDFVDCYTSPSAAHMAFISAQTPSPGKWRVLPNAVDLSQYKAAGKVPGRIVYASSPDRGLHRLLQCWPSIRRGAPHAHLRVFYNFGPWMAAIADKHSHPEPTISELAHRACYIREALRRMGGMGIEVVDSVSRRQIVDELSVAEVLAYPCDTVRYTEGFSVTLMEACAAGALPVTTDVDALGSIYGGHVPMVQAPVGDRLSEYADLVVRGLTDPGWRSSWLDKSTALAARHDWSSFAPALESALRGDPA